MEIKCGWCGRPFDRPGTRGPIPKYCSRSHRQRAYEQRKTDRQIDEAVRKALDSNQQE